jgi:TonB family protein
MWPNTRVQRTRSSPSALRSPLTRKPLGRRLGHVCLLVLWILPGMVGRASAPDPAENPTPVEGKCGTVQAPKLIHRVSPRYPERVRRDKWEGTVTLEAIIRTDGTVSDITVRSSPGKVLSDLMIEAVKQWQYTPAYCSETRKPVQVSLTISSTFSLKQK